MVFENSKILSRIAAVFAAAVCLYSCSPVDLDFNISPSADGAEESFERVPVKDYKDVFLVYSMGFNDLNGYLRGDIEDLVTSPLMDGRRDVMLIFSHLSKGLDFNVGTCPTLTKISRNITGEIVRDTLLTLPATTVAADKETLRKVLEYTKENFSAERYGILLSSHGSGWAPEGYITDPDSYESGAAAADEGATVMRKPRMATPVYNMGNPDGIAVKSMGVHCISRYNTIEMDISDIAAAFPFKMDYIIFDACYMGGIEVAYELRNATEWLIASQTEILGDGMDYKTMASYIFTSGEPDLEGLSRRFYDYYNSQNGTYRSATISLTDCSKLEELARVSRRIFSTYRSGLDALQSSRKVQRYYRSDYSTKQQWYYDFADIIERCGPSEEDLEAFHEAIDKAVVYKAATPYFMNDIRIERHSGLSMYLPFSSGRDYLNAFYRTLEWNKATGLLE